MPFFIRDNQYDIIDVDFLDEKYDQEPDLLIEELLNRKTYNVKDDIEFAVFALVACGRRSLAQTVLQACKKYGIFIKEVITETYV